MKNATLNTAIEAAQQAGTMIARASDRLDLIKITEKGPNDFVTNIDKKAEEIIIEVIQQAFPKHSIMAEESGETTNKHEDQVWIIDPIDGTKNFIHGIPHFAISIAYSNKGKIIDGVVYDPIRQEMFAASRGNGAWLNNQRIRVSQCHKLKNSLIATGFPFRHPEEQKQQAKMFQNILPECSDIRRGGSAALDLAYVAAGRFDAYWELKLCPWDIAAGSLLVKEAGGMVCDPQGGEKYLSSGNIVATTPKLLKPFLQTLSA